MKRKEAWKKVGQIETLQEELQDEFPCPECDGTGEKNAHWPYPSVCEHCWGRGYYIPDDDKGEE